MTKEESKYFNILNKQWERLKPYVSDKSCYKKIMQELITLFFQKMPAEFTDEWWSDVIESFLNYPAKWKGTEYYSFSSNLSMCFLNYWELLYKFTSSKDLFEDSMKFAFDREIERIGTVHLEK